MDILSLLLISSEFVSLLLQLDRDAVAAHSAGRLALHCYADALLRRPADMQGFRWRAKQRAADLGELLLIVVHVISGVVEGVVVSGTLPIFVLLE
jgi:hypothetical protein